MMIDLFKSDYAPLETFSNINFDRRVIHNEVKEKDSHSDIRIKTEENPILKNALSIKEEQEKKVEEESNVYTIDMFGNEIVCGCGVNVKNAAEILEESKKRAVDIDNIVSKLNKKQRECVMAKFNKFKLSDFPDKAVDVVSPKYNNVKKVESKQVVQVEEENDLQEEVMEEETIQENDNVKDDEDSLSLLGDFESNEIVMLIIAILVILIVFN
tara:strand:- start:89 stop:727 length:639 start_codon:yes stop_codon:yes gene_type:complete